MLFTVVGVTWMYSGGQRLSPRSEGDHGGGAQDREAPEGVVHGGRAVDAGQQDVQEAVREDRWVSQCSCFTHASGFYSHLTCPKSETHTCFMHFIRSQDLEATECGVLKRQARGDDRRGEGHTRDAARVWRLPPRGLHGLAVFMVDIVTTTCLG
jgi:hypothetical protein